MEVEKQPSIFINAPRTALRSIEQEENIRKITGSIQVARTLIQMDQPDHRVFRGLTQAAFMPTRMKTLADSITKLADHFVDRLEHLGGKCDFVNDIALWYPLRAVMLMLGVPEEDEALMLKLTQQHFVSTDPSVQEQGKVEAGAAAKEIFSYFTALTAERRKNPKDDIVSLLADVQIDGHPISDFDRNSYFFILAVAGHDTTSASISGTLLALLKHPEAFLRLRADPRLLSSAIDEGIRWTSPVKHFFRTAVADYDLAGQTIREGQSIMLCYPSANRDEDVFENPFEFRIDRNPNPHLAFGFGPHLCLGQHLAKLELRSLFERLLPRVDDIELTGEPRWLEANFVGGLKSLPISYQVKSMAQM
jgi:cytochrome P450